MMIQRKDTLWCICRMLRICSMRTIRNWEIDKSWR
jgi:hypothetical protein